MAFRKHGGHYLYPHICPLAQPNLLQPGRAAAVETFGPEYTRVILDFSRPGKPTDNPYIESFNGSFRDECLNVHWFLSLENAREKIETWRREYNEFRPHNSLGDLSPEMYIQQHEKYAGSSTLERC